MLQKKRKIKTKIKQQTIFDNKENTVIKYKRYKKAKQRLKYLHKSLIKQGYLNEANNILKLYLNEQIKVNYTETGLKTNNILQKNGFEAIYTGTGILFELYQAPKESKAKRIKRPDKLTIKDYILFYVLKQTRLKKINEDLRLIKTELQKDRTQINKELFKRNNKNLYLEHQNKTYSLIYQNSDFKIIEITKIK